MNITDTINIVKGFFDLKSERERNEAVIEVQQRFFELVRTCDHERILRLEAEGRLKALLDENEKAGKWDAESKLYEVFTPRLGITVYKRRDAPEQWAEVKWYCPECFANGRASILQDDSPRSGHCTDANLKCFKCGFGFTMLRRVFREMVCCVWTHD